MNRNEQRVIEVAYNLEQAYLKAKRNNEKNTLKSIIATIYGFNGIAKEIIPDFFDYHKNLYKIGIIHHQKLLSGKVAEIEGIGKGLKFEESDFEV